MHGGSPGTMAADKCLGRFLPALAMLAGLPGTKPLGVGRWRTPCDNPSSPSPNGSVAVVAHHKAGTVASFQLLGALCAPNDGSEESFATAWFSRGGRECCTRRRVHFFVDGVRDVLALLKYDVVVHFIRHPVDMVLSGYLYHARCPEDWTWAPGPFQHALRFPPRSRHPFRDSLDVSSNASFCQLLQRAGPVRGLRAEAARTLGAQDGVGNMARVSSFLSTRMPTRVVAMCMAKYDPSTVSRADQRSYWGALEQRLGLPRGTVHLSPMTTVSTHATAGSGTTAMIRKPTALGSPRLVALAEDGLAKSLQRIKLRQTPFRCSSAEGTCLPRWTSPRAAAAAPGEAAALAACPYRWNA